MQILENFIADRITFASFSINERQLLVASLVKAKKNYIITTENRKESWSDEGPFNISKTCKYTKFHCPLRRRQQQHENDKCTRKEWIDHFTTKPPPLYQWNVDRLYEVSWYVWLKQKTSTAIKGIVLRKNAHFQNKALDYLSRRMSSSFAFFTTSWASKWVMFAAE